MHEKLIFVHEKLTWVGIFIWEGPDTNKDVSIELSPMLLLKGDKESPSGHSTGKFYLSG